MRFFEISSFTSTDTKRELSFSPYSEDLSYVFVALPREQRATIQYRHYLITPDHSSHNRMLSRAQIVLIISPNDSPRARHGAHLPHPHPSLSVQPCSSHMRAERTPAANFPPQSPQPTKKFPQHITSHRTSTRTATRLPSTQFYILLPMTHH